MVLTDRKKTLFAEIALLLCGLLWGTGFVVMKNTLGYLSANWLLALRFLLSGMVIAAFLRGKLLHMNRTTLLGGVLAGVVLYIGFYSQTLGLYTTTAGNNAFLTAVYVVLVPFFQWFIAKKHPGLRAVGAAALCLAGVGVIALQPGFRIRAGDAWTLLAGVLFAVHIVIVAQYSKKDADILALTCVQFFCMALCGAAMGTIFEPFPAIGVLFSAKVLPSLLYLILFCTVFAMGAQNVGLKYAPASHASLLMGTEAPFGCLAGILFLQEPFTPKFLLGALLIAGSIVWSALGNAKSNAGTPANAEPVAEAKITPPLKNEATDIA